MENQPEKQITIRNLYPTASEEQLCQAERNLHAYIKLMIAIADDFHKHPETANALQSLTEKPQRPTLSNSTSKGRINNSTTPRI